jgi:hypothetical protein
MTKRDEAQRHGVLALLEAVSDYDVSAEEARESLRNEGVDVAAFLARVQQAVDAKEKDERLAWKQDAELKRKRFAQTSASVDIFAAMTRAQLEAAVNSGAAAFHMNLQEQSDDDLRSILVDRARLEELTEK